MVHGNIDKEEDVFHKIVIQTSSELLKILPEPFQKDPKPTNPEGSCYPIDLASLRVVLHPFVWTSVEFSRSSVGLRLSGGGSVPFRSGGFAPSAPLHRSTSRKAPLPLRTCKTRLRNQPNGCRTALRSAKSTGSL